MYIFDGKTLTKEQAGVDRNHR